MRDLTYSERVSMFIRQRYTIDDEIALINNYNLDKEKYQEEYEEYQEYRAQCKEWAKQV